MTKERLLVVIKLIIGVLCLSLIIFGQKNIGLTGSGLMLLGLAGLLALLYSYNKKFT